MQMHSFLPTLSTLKFLSIKVFVFKSRKESRELCKFFSSGSIIPFGEMKYSPRYLEYEVIVVDRGSTASSTKVLSQPAYFEFIKQGKTGIAQYPSGKNSVYSYSISGMEQDPKMRVKIW